MSSNTFADTLPSGYGYVLLSCVVLPTFTSLFMGDRVMRARKALNINYPNLYAVPGFHDKADDFNRVQRGHQNYLENIADFRFMALVGGLKHPFLCALSGLVYCLGSVLYQKGYGSFCLLFIQFFLLLFSI